MSEITAAGSPGQAERTTTGVSEDEAVPARHYAFLTFLMLLNVMNFVDRQLLASFANFIVPDLGLTNAQFGLLTGFAFIVFYAAMGLFMGAAADMLHRPRLVAAGLSLWSALTAISGAATSFLSLAVPRMFIGIGESVLTPTSMSMLADRFPASRLGFAAGVYYMGVPIGVGLSLIVAGFLGPSIGWRNCFYLLGAIGICLAIVMLFVKETPRRHGPVANAAGVVERPRLKEIFATAGRALRDCPALALTVAGGVALHFILGAAAFDQLWFVAERGFERADIAQKTGMIAVVAGMMGNLFGGMGGDWFAKKTGHGRAMFLFWIMLVLAPINIAYRLVPGDSPWFWIGVFVGYFQLGSFYGPTFASVQELVPPQIRATVVAFYILMLNLVGLGFGITAGGYCIDWMIAAGVEEPYTWTLVTFTGISLLAIPLFFVAGRRFSGDKARLFALEAARTASR
ncbi:MAG TPA: MFS transporter [Pseudomonadales bacterium]|nr:MFS transporter [Pseudomonadales bacterium]